MAGILSIKEDLRGTCKAFTGQRIAVAGAGGIGCVIGGYLTQAGADVWFVDPWLEHVRALQAHGLVLQDPDTTSSVRVKALHSSEVGALGDIDVCLVCVKSYDTASTVSLIKSSLRPGAFAVSCQNGMNEDTIASLLGASFTLGCVIHLGAILMGPGHAQRVRRGGHLVVGELDGRVTERVKSLALLLSSCAETIITDNLRGHRWVKLAYNCSGNPLLALTGYTVQELHAQEKTTPLLRAIIRELVRVAEACGDRVEPIHGIPADLWKTDVFTRVDAIEEAFCEHARLLGNRRSSTVYDLEQGRPMETDYLNGFVVRKGEEAGVATPVNRAIAEMLHDLEQGRVQPHPTTLVPLLTLVEQSYRT